MNLNIYASDLKKYQALRNVDLPNDLSTFAVLSIYKILFLCGLSKLSSFDILLSGQSGAER